MSDHARDHKRDPRDPRCVATRRGRGSTDAATRAFAGGERGFALLVALLAIVGLTAMATGGFLLSNTDTKMTRSYGAATTAFYMADAGLKQFLGTQDGEPTVTSVTYSFPDGTADVTATELVAVGNGQRVWRIVSVGRPNPPNDDVQREVSTMALLDPVVITPPGGLVVAGTWNKSGGSGTTSGMDASSTDDCPEGGENQAGVYTWEYVGDEAPADGDPPIVETRYDFASSPINPYEYLENQGWGVDWPKILAGDEISFDYVVDDFNTDGVPTDWPSVGSGEWPVIFIDYDARRDGTSADEVGSGVTPAGVDDSVTINASCCSGQGVIIAEENLKTSGSWTWDGLIMAGGQFHSSGNNTFRGSIMVGLNTTFDYSDYPTDSDLESIFGSGNKDYQYHTCNLFTAAREAGDLIDVRHTWTEAF